MGLYPQTQLSDPATRGKDAKSKKKNPNLVWRFAIPEKTVVLTFDDGPHYRHTDTILDTLVKLKRDKEAVAYYEHYLFLYPSSPEAEKIKGKIKVINCPRL